MLLARTINSKPCGNNDASSENGSDDSRLLKGKVESTDFGTRLHRCLNYDMPASDLNCHPLSPSPRKRYELGMLLRRPKRFNKTRPLTGERGSQPRRLPQMLNLCPSPNVSSSAQEHVALSISSKPPLTLQLKPLLHASALLPVRLYLAPPTHRHLHRVTKARASFNPYSARLSHPPLQI